MSVLGVTLPPQGVSEHVISGLVCILGPQRSIVKVSGPAPPSLSSSPRPRPEAAPRGPRRQEEAEVRPDHRGLAWEVGTVPQLVVLPQCLGVGTRRCRPEQCCCCWLTGTEHFPGTSTALSTDTHRFLHPRCDTVREGT